MKLVKRVFILGIVLTLGLVTFAQAEMSHLVDDHVLVNDIEQEVVPELPPCPILDEALAASQYDQRINGNTTESDGMYLEEQADVPDDVLDSLEEPWIEAQEDIELGLEEQATSPVPAASQQYYNNGGIIAPYLFARSDGYERVEWIKSYDSTTPKLIVERYDFNFKIKSQKNIALSQITPRGATASTTFLGGVFEGKNANFVVTGQPNTEQSVSKKVIRVTKFDKNWKYLANCQLSKDSFGANANYGVEVYGVFGGGTLRMLEQNNLLWVSTAHTGFAGSDGYHHQGNLSFIINTDSMTEVGNAYDFGHSFDQYLTSCEGIVYGVDLYEGARKVFLYRQNAANYRGGWVANSCGGAIDEFWNGWSENVLGIFDFWKKDNGIWSYALYGGIGGVESSESQSRILVVGYSYDQTKIQAGDGSTANNSSNIWIRSIPANFNNSTKYTARQLTNYAPNTKNAGKPQLTKINDNRFLVSWQVTNNDYSSGGVEYVFIDAQGNPLTAIKKLQGFCSSVKPVVNHSGDIVWYATVTTGPLFHVIGADGSSRMIASITKPMYRLYNPNSGEHFYTAATGEKNHLVSVGWRYEGIGWYAPEYSNTQTYRLYNPNAGDHHYTTSLGEANHLTSVGWRYEGVGWYSDDNKTIPLYRQYNPNAHTGTHNYTTNKAENDMLVRLGWRAEGIGWYGVRN